MKDEELIRLALFYAARYQQELLSAYAKCNTAAGRQAKKKICRFLAAVKRYRNKHFRIDARGK